MGVLAFFFAFLFVAVASILPFLIHPVLGVAWILWLIGVAIYTVKKINRKQ